MDNQNDENIYILDTNILIDLWLWQPFKFSISFWNKIEELLESGRWVLLDVVVNELTYENEIKRWAKKQKSKGLVIDIDDNVKNRAAEINDEYKIINPSDGRSRADTYIIAYAEINNLSIFTREGFMIDGDELHKIPDVCKKLKIKYIRHLDKFMREMGFEKK